MAAFAASAVRPSDRRLVDGLLTKRTIGAAIGSVIGENRASADRHRHRWPRSSPGNCAPARRQLLSATLREREDGVGRIRGAGGRKDAGAGDVEVRQLMGLTKAVGD